jgi:hypothetical protein
MYGTLLDQRVFEGLVEKTMPILWDHLQKSDVQLSVVSLPWFLSLYINSMPLVFAFRILDVFFLEGPKVLFQIGLAILRINGEELLDAADDGSFISVLKNYFARLDESAHPKSENAKLRAVTRFQELMVVAFKEFSGITQDTIAKQRSQHKEAVLESIESFAKRTSIRNLGPESKKLSTNDLGFLYDRFYDVLYDRQQRAQLIKDSQERRAKAGRAQAQQLVTGIPIEDTPEMGRIALGSSDTLMDYGAFREFLVGVSRWAMADNQSPSKSDAEKDASYFSSTKSRNFSLSPWGAGPDPADDEFMRRLFRRWDVDGERQLTLQNVVNGMAKIKGARDIMLVIEYFFSLFDDDDDGKVDREGMLRMSEALLFLGRRGFQTPSASSASLSPEGAVGSPEVKGLSDEEFLAAVSSFTRRCFEYADVDNTSLSAAPTPQIGSEPPTDALDDFAIGSDNEEDLVDLGPSSPKKPNSKTPTPTSPTTADPLAIENLKLPPMPSEEKPNTHRANIALDPSKPLFITLPTFRMLVLADEALEHFFDVEFAASFRLADTQASSAGGNLTTFSNLGRRVSSSVGTAQKEALVPGAGGVVPPGRQGLRGMLDNIVTDGMRVATEVRRRMEEAQRELENASGPQTHDRDDEEDDDEADRKSVFTKDTDLLEGADAEAISANSRAPSLMEPESSVASTRSRTGSGSDEKGGGGVVEFER